MNSEFKAFNKFMRRYKPRFLIHGHTHDVSNDKDTCQYNDTTVINVFGYKILDIEPEQWT